MQFQRRKSQIADDVTTSLGPCKVKILARYNILTIIGGSGIPLPFFLFIKEDDMGRYSDSTSKEKLLILIESFLENHEVSELMRIVAEALEEVGE